MISEGRINENLKDIIHGTIDKACELIREYNDLSDDLFANVIASICDVSVEDLMTDSGHLRNSHARWFYWFAYRYMTNESYGSIAEKTRKRRLFTESCVGICVAKMSMMIEQEPMWGKRWVIAKRIIKSIQSCECSIGDETPTTITLKVTYPKGVIVKVQSSNEK